MVIPHTPYDNLFRAYDDLEDAVKETKWWQFGARRKLRQRLYDLRCEGAVIGFNQGIQDLVEAGILTKVSSPE